MRLDSVELGGAIIAARIQPHTPDIPFVRQPVTASAVSVFGINRLSDNAAMIQRFSSFLCAASVAFAATPDIASVFGNTEGAFVLHDLRSGRYVRHNPSRCRE